MAIFLFHYFCGFPCCSDPRKGHKLSCVAGWKHEMRGCGNKDMSIPHAAGVGMPCCFLNVEDGRFFRLK